MNILGLHFGHDAAASVVVDGNISSYIMRERYNRVKHAMTLDMATIERALKDAALDWNAIDYVAVTSTQRKECIIDAPDRLQIRMGGDARHTAPSPLVAQMKEAGIRVEDVLHYDLQKYLYDDSLADTLGAKAYKLFYPEYAKREYRETGIYGWLDSFIQVAEWANPIGFHELAQQDVGKFLSSETYRKSFHYPVSVTIDGVSKPGYYIHHHMCHAASVFFASGYDDAAIITHDGHSRPADYGTGMFYYATGNKIYPIASHYLHLGALYDHVGIRLNLGIVGPAGKLMGLASWGKPAFFDERFVGNWGDIRAVAAPDGNYREAWMEHCLSRARAMGYDIDALGDTERMTDPINADIASSTQFLFEKSMEAAGDCLKTMLSKAGASPSGLCLSGGTALNCPANSRLWRAGLFPNVFVEPGCDDGGIAMGAALALYHNVLDCPRRPAASPFPSPYLGMRREDADVDRALARYADRISVDRADDTVYKAAEMLAANKVIAWYEGRSEVGPRALGHRTIIADCRDEKNWQHVNRIKGREFWRPFAPAVLEEEAQAFFSGCPLPSPYMLFTAEVISDRIPAVTHVDKSSRIQTVPPGSSEFRRLIEMFAEKTGVPVVMNTSFNGPGEPIVEQPEEALDFLLRTEIDALWMDGRLCRRTGK